MDNINDIKISIPENTVELKYFLKILTMCKNITVIDKHSIQASSDRKLKPTTTFVTETVSDPSVSFITNTHLEKESFWIDKLQIGFNLKRTYMNPRAPEKIQLTKISDNIGDYLQVSRPEATYSQLNFNQLYDRITNKVVSIDHVGVNMNPYLLSKEKYEKMKTMVAERTFLSDYPYGKEWPFVIPTSLVERRQKIKIGVKRDPKFEFFYNFNSTYPEIQLDIQTNLSPKEVLGLFPQPYGYYDPTPLTGDYCFNVFIYTGWQNVSLRIDLRFYIPNFSHTDFLIKNGSRV